ncbi:glycosyltransferase, partial [Brevirhabdus pacifica]
MSWLYTISGGIVLFSLVGYGLLWIVLARLFGRSRPHPGTPVRATMLIAARNEGADIADKLRSVLAQDLGGHALEILVVSDGSEDDTAAQVRALDVAGVRLLELPAHEGKAAALNAGLGAIDGDRVVIFSDANALLRPGALARLLAPFGDPSVGGSIGQLEIAA